MKMIRTVLAHVLLVGLERNIATPQESITFNNKKSQIENIEKFKEKDKQHDENKRQNTRKKKHWEKPKNMMTKTKGIEKETEKQ